MTPHVLRPKRRITGARSNGRLGQRHEVPEACVARLSLYVRVLSLLKRKRVTFVSSRRLAEQLGLTDAQVRRDLSYFGQFGTSGRGYEVRRLHERLTGILGVSGRAWNVALAGVGNLGSALLAYQGFQNRGFAFRVIVDASAHKVGQTMAGVKVQAASELERLARTQQIHIGLIAVPAGEAQTVCDQLVEGGVKAIVNFAPIRLAAPPDVRISDVDLAVELESLAFYLMRSHHG